MAKAFSVFVEIGGRVAPSLGNAINRAENRLRGLSKTLRTQAIASKASAMELKSAFKSLAGFAAAGGIGAGIKHSLGAGAELAHEVQALKNAGRTYKEVAEGIAEANKTILAVPTSTLTENIKVLNETTGAFGDYHHALENLQFNTKMGSVLHNSIGDKAGSTSEMFNSLVRAFEIRGTAADPHVYQREVSELARAMIFTGGNVNPHEILNFAQQANPAIKNYSERFLTKIAPSLIQEFGGDRAGTRANAWYNVVTGKAKDKRLTEAWMKTGLLDKKQVLKNKQGDYVGWQVGAMKGTDLALQDPLEWTEKYLIPSLEKQGINVDDQLAVTKELAKLFRNSEANRFAQVITQSRDRKRLHKDEGLINQVGNFGDIYDETLLNDPKLAFTALKSSFENFFSALTIGMMKPFAKAMVTVARAFNYLATVLSDNPRLATTLGGIAAALGAYSSLRLMSWALGVTGLGRAIVFLAASVPLNLAARLLGLARGIVAVSAAVAFGGANRLRNLAAGIAVLGAVGGKRAVFGALIGSFMRLGGFALRLLNPLILLRGALMAIRFVCTPIGALVTAIAVALAALGLWIYNNFGGIIEFFGGFYDGFSKAFGGESSGMLDTLVSWLKDAWNWINDLLGPIDATGKKWHSWGEAAGAAIGGALRFLTDPAQWVEAGKAAFNALWDGMKAVANEIVAWARNLGSNIGSGIGGAIKSVFGGASVTPVPNEADTFGYAPPAINGRAVGGPIVGGRTYLVGEKGPELITPSQSGYVHTASATQKMLNSSLLSRLASIGAVGDAVGAPRFKLPSDMPVEQKNISITRGDTSFSVTINAANGNAQDIASKVRAEVFRALSQLEAEQRGMLHD